MITDGELGSLEREAHQSVGRGGGGYRRSCALRPIRIHSRFEELSGEDLGDEEDDMSNVTKHMTSGAMHASFASSAEYPQECPKHKMDDEDLDSIPELMPIERENKFEDISAIDDIQKSRGSNKLVMTVDSGESVCGPQDAPGYAIQPIEDQRNGAYYLAAGCERLPNMGETHIHIQSHEGKQCRVRMQVTNVRNTLLSVARMCDEQNRIVFERDGGCVAHLVAGERVHFARGLRRSRRRVSPEAERGICRPP